ncbi:MAG: hypothetical protein EA411_12670 [Saprospirales bacterium]|nr:MAG: hypothetical protein EA411_12670 [Saprospirales bacterium]
MSDTVKESYIDFHVFSTFQEIAYGHLHDYISAIPKEPASFRILRLDFLSDDLLFIDSVKFKYNDSGNEIHRERFR